MHPFERVHTRSVTIGVLSISTVFAAMSACCGSAAKPPQHPARTPEPSHAAPGSTGATYYTQPDVDHGLVQSPVNILSAQTVEGKHAVAVHYSHESATFVENKGHTVELDFPTGSTIDFDGKQYELKQLHFHTPSEHQIDGMTFPMEVHIVNLRKPPTPDAPPEYLVIGVLFRMGTTNAFIESFIDAVPKDDPGHEDLPPGRVFIDELLSHDQMPAYYHYRGSLTTPPYTETVEWFVLEQPLEASPSQIQRINALEGDNARHVQALYDREVER